MGEILEQLGLNGFHMIFYAINLLVVFFALYGLLFTPVKKMIKERKDALEAIYSENDRLNKEATTMRQTYEEKFEEKRREIAKITDEMTKAAEEKTAAIVSNANKEARAILDKAAEEIEKEEQRLHNRFKTETGELALQIASTILARELTEKDNDMIIDEALAKWSE